MRFSLAAWLEQAKELLEANVGGNLDLEAIAQYLNMSQGVFYSDFWRAYQAVIPDEQHQVVSKQSGLTNHVERFNNTIRQRLARFVRKTLSFSKSEHMHLICLHLFLHRYNLERKAIHYR